MQVWKEQDSIEENPIGLSAETVKQLMPALDAHQATLYVLYHQYQKHHWVVEGPQFRDLHIYFQESYEAVQKAVDAIAERMTALGGIPTSSPTAFAAKAYIEHEPEGSFRVKDMVTRDRMHEGEIAVKLRETVGLARELVDYGTEHLLAGILLEVEDRAHHLDHYLGDDSL